MDEQDEVQFAQDHGDSVLAMADEVSEAVSEVLAEMAEAVVALAKHSIEAGGKSGIVTLRGDEIHQSSAPGEAPASDSGHLAESIGMLADNQSSSEVQIAAQAEYAGALELGTSRMAARPFLQPALMEIAPDLKQEIRDAIRAVIRRR